MKINHAQMESLATLAALGGEASIKKLDQSERSVFKVALEALKNQKQDEEIGLTEDTFNSLELKMYNNLGSIPKERSNFFVRLGKGILNLLWRTSSMDVASLIPLDISTKVASHKALLSQLSEARMSMHNNCESAWDNLSMFDQKQNEHPMVTLIEQVVEITLSVSGTLNETFKNPEIEKKIDLVALAMKANVLTQLNAPIEKADLDAKEKWKKIFDDYIESLVKITNEFYNVSPSKLGITTGTSVASSQAAQPAILNTEQEALTLIKNTIAKANELSDQCERLNKMPLENLNDANFTSIKDNSDALSKALSDIAGKLESNQALQKTCDRVADTIDALIREQLPIFFDDKDDNLNKSDTVTNLKKSVSDLSKRIQSLPEQTGATQETLNELKADKPMQMNMKDAEEWTNDAEFLLSQVDNSALAT